MIEFRRRTLWERLLYLWPAERRRQDARLKDEIDRLLGDPLLPCIIEGKLIPHGFGEERTSARPCTCHPDEAPVPCQRKYAFSECMKAASEERTS